MGRIRYMISDAAKRLDVEPHVLRYWEEELSVDIPRNEMGHRYYTEEDIVMMRGVKCLKEKGFQLKSIRILLPEIDKVMKLEPRRMLELRDRLELAVSKEELRQQREEELRQEEDCQTETDAKESEKTEGWSKTDAKTRDQEEPWIRTDVKGKDQAETWGRADAKVQDSLTEDCLDKPLTDLTPKEYRETADQKDREDFAAGTLVQLDKKQEETEPAVRMARFRSIMNDILLDALSENNRRMTENITESVSREISYHFKQREMMEEEHYKQLDRTLREYQQGQKQAAVSREYQGTRRESKFFKKNGKVRI